MINYDIIMTSLTRINFIVFDPDVSNEAIRRFFIDQDLQHPSPGTWVSVGSSDALELDLKKNFSACDRLDKKTRLHLDHRPITGLD